MVFITESIREAGREALRDDGWNDDVAGECSVDDVFNCMLEKTLEGDEFAALRMMGFKSDDIKNVIKILETEKTSLKSLLYQALNKFKNLNNMSKL